ncbi:CLUMA_CG005856, isoform A [Clunio marinus]|uniref:Oligopeptide transporter 1 n=1 Tax=Clunio marinus TaxID=568069 RepID=A0A1J1HW66_9DIPT|nr:CLUMA_CG005856, isoform A [Clunio marinus]
MLDQNVITTANEAPKYPKSIAFIISNEFCERFNYYGMRTILVLYMTIKLGYSDDTATVLFHVFTSLVYFFPILGAIIADSFLGKFRTILYLSCVYAIGSASIAVGAIPVLHLPAQSFTIIGLLLIGIGSGGIKPCVAAFGGDQFKLPEQAKQLATFFSFFYFAINAGSLISTYLMPILREDVHCFGDLDCFSLAFGIPGVLMIASIIVFVAGKALYIVKQPAGNVIVKVTKCIFNAISEKSKQSQKQLSHWLDYAEPAYGKEMVNDVKSVLKILLLFVPLPLFWALFDQQGSRWTFQATRMNGDIGFTEIKPDQMQVINPLLILVFIPIFDCAIYPFLAKIGLRRPLQKLAAGGILAGVAFLVSGLVELQLEKTYPVFPQPNESQPGKSSSFFVKSSPKALSFEEKIDKTKSGYPTIRVLSDLESVNFIKFVNNKGEESKKIVTHSINQFEILPSSYSVYADNIKLGDVELLLGGVYTIVISKSSSGGIEMKTHIITSPNSIHMLWLIPQFVIMTAGEVMFSVTGLEFAYSQAPTTMKSLLQACWLLTVAFGDVIVVIIAEAKIFQSQANEFFLFAIMMFIDMAIFGLLAMKYKYVKVNDKKDDSDMENAIPIEKTRKTFTNDAFQDD